MKIAVYAEQFDPITLGHIDVIKQASRLFDKVIILITESDNSLFTPQEISDLFIRVMNLRSAHQVTAQNIVVDILNENETVASYAAAVHAQAIVTGLGKFPDIDILGVEILQEVATAGLSSTVKTAIQNEERWEHLVPDSIVKQIQQKIGGASRLVTAPASKVDED